MLIGRFAQASGLGHQVAAELPMSGNHANRSQGGRGPAREPRSQLLLALWGAGLVLFNFPMLIVWDSDMTVLGLPLLPVALFGIWAALIGVLAWASERPRHTPGP
jgi:hypothetical protein